jgi:hypothetical protein
VHLHMHPGAERTIINSMYTVYCLLYTVYCIMHVVKRTGSRRGGGEEPGGPKWREILGRGGGGGSLPVSPYFSFNLKFKFLFTFEYTVDLPHQISFFAMVHSTL